ncbi:MAG TPA: 16S rRNA (guanine(966)-N(2))-methyltransferase RsmD [Terracidiphilus sp.]
MRVIAGRFCSGPLQAASGMGTRPTSDRLRETLFNVLAPRIQGARFLDLYSGSGAVGIEALSRGATHVTFVEKARPALVALRANLDRLGIRKDFAIQAGGVATFLRNSATTAGFDIVFLDPPYDLAAEYATVLNLLGSPASQFRAPGAIVIAEHRRKDSLADAYGVVARTRLLQQGDAALSFYAEI